MIVRKLVVGVAQDRLPSGEPFAALLCSRAGAEIERLPDILDRFIVGVAAERLLRGKLEISDRAGNVLRALPVAGERPVIGLEISRDACPRAR